MRRNFMLSFAIILGLAFPAFQLNAMTISTNAIYHTAGPNVIDSSTAEYGSISSQVSANDWCVGTANAAADASGYLSVSASHEATGYDFTGMYAEASFTEDFLNTSDDYLYYYLDFEIVNEYIQEVEGYGIMAPTDALTTANIQILLNDSVIWNSTTSASVSDNGYSLPGSTDIEFEYYEEVEYYPPDDPLDLVYCYASATGSYQNVFPLGIFEPGDSFTLEYRVAAMATGLDAGFASSSFDVMGSVGSAAPVPEPAAIFLISSGLIALVGFKKLSSVDHDA